MCWEVLSGRSRREAWDVGAGIEGIAEEYWGDGIGGGEWKGCFCDDTYVRCCVWTADGGVLLLARGEGLTRL